MFRRRKSDSLEEFNIHIFKVDKGYVAGFRELRTFSGEGNTAVEALQDLTRKFEIFLEEIIYFI